MSLSRSAAVVASLSLALTAGAVAPALADESIPPAVQTSARDLGDCKAEFTIINTTNVTTFTIDWQIDDEPLRDVDYADFQVGRTGGMSSTVSVGPRWPDDIPTEGENTEQKRWMRSGLPASTATYVKDLKNLDDSYNPPLPNPDADTHTVRYRIVLGPGGNNAEPFWVERGNMEWLGDRQWKEITVTGCAEPEEEEIPDPSNPIGDLLAMSTDDSYAGQLEMIMELFGTFSGLLGTSAS